MTHPPIIIIGAGIGGMSAAIHLAAAGKSVRIVEQNPAAGGKMGQVQAAGFRWDTGPSVITMRPVLEDLFTVAHRNLTDYLTLLPIDPLTRYVYPDGTRLNIQRTLSETLAQIEALSPADVEGYLRYLAYAAGLYRVAAPSFVFGPPPGLSSLSSVPLRDYPKIDPLRTMQQAIDGFVRHPHLRQLLGRFATYVGASPYLAPATLNVIAHVELNGGVWYPQGGVYALAQAYQQLAQELGVEFQFNAQVKQILVEDGAAKGIVLVSGEVLPAAAVLANVDVATVYEHLLPPQVLPARKVRRHIRRAPSCSGFVLLLGVRGEHPQLAHHNIFFSRDYRQEFAQIFEQRIPPTEPTLYLAITSKTDAQHAPANHENWFILVNVPADDGSLDWRTFAPQYRDQILAQLAQFGLDVRQNIVVEQHITPSDLARLTGARGGALYGASSNDRFAAFLRPHNREKDLKGLYYCGGTTHPGGGVPMVTRSGKLAAQMILEDARDK
ncbi:MAG: phytoene desaturase family protein [Anaerolineales bacterium]